MELPAGAAWSDAVEEAAWIGERLAPAGAGQVTSVVPGGFAAYARVLHPAEDTLDGDRLVRWAEVVAWSGTPLRADAQFHTIALPPVRPERDAPWSGQGPRQGELYPPDAKVLAGIARDWTATPERCWFCLQGEYGEGGAWLTPPGEPSMPLPDPVPEAVRHGPRVRLPDREYLLYTGPVEAVLTTDPLTGGDQATHLWWPADRAWCVASQIGLAWTYVAGPAGLIERVLADTRIEALPAGPGDPAARVEDWVTGWVAEAVTTLVSEGKATITTPRGTVEAWLERPAWPGRGTLRTRSSDGNGVRGSGERPLSHRDGEGLRDEITVDLTCEVIGLAGG